MKLAGFTYVRNGFDYGVPFLESIQSVLPICSEFIVAVGDSTDGTREAIVQLNNPKIKIIAIKLVIVFVNLFMYAYSKVY